MASSCGSHRPSYTKSCETWIGHKLGEAAAAPRRQAVDQCRPIARLHHKSQVAFWALLGCTARLALPCPPWVLYAPAAGLRSLCDGFECKMLAQLVESIAWVRCLGHVRTPEEAPVCPFHPTLPSYMYSYNRAPRIFLKCAPRSARSPDRRRWHTVQHAWSPSAESSLPLALPIPCEREVYRLPGRR